MNPRCFRATLTISLFSLVALALALAFAGPRLSRRGNLGGGNRSPCRSPKNWFRAEYTSGFRERRTFGKDDAQRRRRDAAHLSRSPGSQKGGPKRRIGRPVGRSVGRSLARSLASLLGSRASLDGLGVSFRVGPQPARSLLSLFLSPSPPLRLLRLPLAFSLPRARGPWE